MIQESRTIFDVANYFLSIANKTSGSYITPLKLQKLCYYAQALSLARNNCSLFDEDFEAWVHGPVCVELYHKYSDSYMRDSKISECGNYVLMDCFTLKQTKVLNDVWNAYGNLTGGMLENMTHNETPWRNARKGLESWQCGNTIIHKDSIKNYFQSRLVQR